MLFLDGVAVTSPEGRGETQTKARASASRTREHEALSGGFSAAKPRKKDTKERKETWGRLLCGVAHDKGRLPSDVGAPGPPGSQAPWSAGPLLRALDAHLSGTC